MGNSDVQKKDKGRYDWLSKRRKLLSHMNKTTQSYTPSLEPQGQGQIKKFRFLELQKSIALTIDFIRQVLSMANPFHTFPKLECQGDGSNDPVCNRWVFKAVNKNRRKVLDETEMFLPSLDFFCPVNFLCGAGIGSSDIKNRLDIRKSSYKHIRRDFAVSDALVCAKASGGRVLRK